DFKERRKYWRAKSDVLDWIDTIVDEFLEEFEELKRTHVFTGKSPNKLKNLSHTIGRLRKIAEREMAMRTYEYEDEDHFILSHIYGFLVDLHYRKTVMYLERG
ncbi:hypothetical protein PMAYCL1PPCAC_06071, partial [Pristionchus mayeri]